MAELGRELREARLSAGLRQVDVARAAGISPSWVSRIERGLAADVSFRLLSILLAIVGLDLSARAYPGGDPLRDEGHRRMRARVRSLLPGDAPWQTEVPVAGRGDLRAWDAMTRLWGLRVAIEIELRPSDLQALERRLALKLRDGNAHRLVLVIADTRRNRALLRLAAEDLSGVFRLQGSAAKAALRSPNDPGCNLLVLA